MRLVDRMRAVALRRPDVPTGEHAAVPALGVAACGILLWIAGGWTARSGTEDFYPWQVKFALLCGALALQLLARSRPGLAFALLTFLVAWDLLFGPSVVLWVALSDVIYLATAIGSDRLQRVVAWAAVAMSVTASAIAGVDGGVRAAVYAALIMIALTWSPIGYARAVRAYRRLAQIERDESERRRATALTEERRRLARELHDTVAGHLSAVAILADAAQRSPGDPAVLQSIRSGSLAALEEMRSTIDLLASPDDAAVRTTFASLEPLIEVAEAAGGAVTISGTAAGAELPVAVEATATRILGEAITNATKHAPGAPLDIVLDTEPDGLALTATNAITEDEGVGKGNGLQNMAFRAESIGGAVTAGRTGPMWIVRARIPLRVSPA